MESNNYYIINDNDEPNDSITKVEYYTEEFCKYQECLYNYRIRMCSINKDIDKCDTCPHREPRIIKSTLTHN